MTDFILNSKLNLLWENEVFLALRFQTKPHGNFNARKAFSKYLGFLQNYIFAASERFDERVLAL